MKNLYTMDPCMPDIRKVGKELRKTHFKMGNDNPDNTTQYRDTYTPKPLDLAANNDPNLRKSHWGLGGCGDPVPLSTTYKDAYVGEGEPAVLDANTKNDLRKAHFNYGNNPPDLNTVYRIEYTPKKASYQPATKPPESANYVPCGAVTDYLPEYKARYTTPPLTKVAPKVSTADLQKSHYNFGNYPGPGNSTHFDSYVPHPLETAQPAEPVKAPNFCLGDDYPTKTSVYRDTYVPKPININCINKELAKDLRKHHFPLGTLPPDMNTIYRTDYTEKPIEEVKVDPMNLRGTHWQLGGCGDTGNYDTTYNVTHTPKKRIPNDILDNKNFVSSMPLNLPGQYNTEYIDNYIPLECKPNKLLQPDRKSNIQFNPCGQIPDWGTTYNDAMKYDPNAAKDAKGVMNPNLKDDLRKVHFNLGDGFKPGKSTYEDNYVPWPLEASEPDKEPVKAKKLPFEGDTTYHADYVPKPIAPPCPPDDEYKDPCADY